MDEETAKHIVREKYGQVAKGIRAKPSASCCRSAETITPNASCCGGGNTTAINSKTIGYSTDDLKSVPSGSNMGLGCGNPLGIASLKEGDVVLDLGSGGGFDCFLASKKVGKNGKVIGVDMTPEMLEKARTNAKRGGYENVEFRLGEIEHLPVADNAVDLIISNCVINLVPNKQQVFKESFRVLKPGGRVMISDLVLTRELPEILRESVALYSGCVAGASLKEDYLGAMKQAGFQSVVVEKEEEISAEFITQSPLAEDVSPELIVEYGDAVRDITVSATKPPK
jgi:arsenite methyltransferase